MKTKDTMNAARARIVEAERELERAKAEHRQAFRAALVALFNEYGLALGTNGAEGSRLEIEDLNGNVFRIGDLPK
jgi:hypothetical protein